MLLALVIQACVRVIRQVCTFGVKFAKHRISHSKFTAEESSARAMHPRRATIEALSLVVYLHVCRQPESTWIVSELNSLIPLGELGSSFTMNNIASCLYNNSLHHFSSPYV